MGTLLLIIASLCSSASVFAQKSESVSLGDAQQKLNQLSSHFDRLKESLFSTQIIELGSDKILRISRDREHSKNLIEIIKNTSDGEEKIIDRISLGQSEAQDFESAIFNVREKTNILLAELEEFKKISEVAARTEPKAHTKHQIQRQDVIISDSEILFSDTTELYLNDIKVEIDRFPTKVSRLIRKHASETLFLPFVETQESTAEKVLSSRLTLAREKHKSNLISSAVIVSAIGAVTFSGFLGPDALKAISVAGASLMAVQVGYSSSLKNNLKKRLNGISRLKLNWIGLFNRAAKEINISLGMKCKEMGKK